MSATAAWPTTINVGGTSTAVTGEACTLLTGTVYQIDAAAKRVWDPSVTPIAYDGGVPATISSSNYLLGTVTLAAPPGGAVTVDVNYIPLLPVVQAKAMKLGGTLDTVDVSIFGAVDKAYLATLRTFRAVLGTFDTLLTDLDSGGDTWKWASKINGTPIFVEIDAGGGAGNGRYRFWSLLDKTETASAVDAAVEGNLEVQATTIVAADGSRVTFACGT